MNNKINYEFRNNISIYNISNEYNEYNENINPINSMSSTFESETHINLGKKTITKNYFYDIKKNINAKYLIIQYTEGTGEYLIIENTRINWGYMRVFFLTFLFIFVFLILLIRCGTKIYVKYKLFKRFNQPIQSMHIVPAEITPQSQNVPTVSNIYSI